MYSNINTLERAQSRSPLIGLITGISMLVVLAVITSGKALAFALPDFETLVKQHGKAVVKISVTGEQKLTASPQFDPEAMPEQFRKFFENNPNPFGGPQGRPSSGFGSGFILSEDGYIVTNAHVVDNASEITVAMPDRRQFTAELIGADKRTDLALLKVSASDLPTLELGDSDSLNVGQWVLAIGTPFGFDYTATQGIVSALSRSLPNENYVPFIQTDVAVNPGNSGGPLFNTEGKVIGVNSQIFSRSGGYMGLSFAIPSNVVKTVVAQLKEAGYVSRGWLGVLIQNVDKSLAESFGMDRPEGALVSKVSADSPAAAAGLKTGDIILEFNDRKIGQSSHLPPIVGAIPVGNTVAVKVLRSGEIETLNVTIAELKEDRQVLRTSSLKSSDHSRLGVVVAPLSKEQKESMEIENGVIVKSVDSQGVAGVAGIVEGDVIVSFNQDAVTSVEALAKLVQDAPAGESIAVLIHRNNNPLFTALTLPE